MSIVSTFRLKETIDKPHENAFISARIHLGESHKLYNSLRPGAVYLTNTHFSIIFHTTHSLGSFDLVDDCNADIIHSLPPPQFFKGVTLVRSDNKLICKYIRFLNIVGIRLHLYCTACIFIELIGLTPINLSLLSQHTLTHYFRQMHFVDIIIGRRISKPLQLDIPSIQTSSWIILSSFINQLSLMQN